MIFLSDFTGSAKYILLSVSDGTEYLEYSAGGQMIKISGSTPPGAPVK